MLNIHTPSVAENLIINELRRGNNNIQTVFIRILAKPIIKIICWKNGATIQCRVLITGGYYLLDRK